MSFKHKLSARLALMRGALLAAAVAAACTLADEPSGPTRPGAILTQILVHPHSVTLEAGTSARFAAYGRTRAGDSIPAVVTWSATGGAISAEGVFVAGPNPGGYVVTATAAEGGSMADTATVSLVAAAALSVASVEVTPATASVFTGASVQFAAIPRDASGNPLVGRAVTWTSSDAAVATVTSAGLVTGGAPGSATITATSEGRSGSASITVSGGGGGGGAAPWVEEDFAGYGSTAQLVNTPNPAIWAQLNLSANLSQVALDQSVGYTAGGLSQSMRYDFQGIGAQCRDYSIRLGFFKFPTPILPGQSVWVEAVVRFAPNFVTDAGASGCNSDYKFLFVGANPDGRVELKSGTYGNPGFWSGNYPGGVADTDNHRTASTWDGEWHTYRIYARVSTTPSTADGAYAVWVDGVKIIDRQNLAYRNSSGGAVTSLWAVTPGANLNQGPLNPTSIWWGRLRAWNTNPGW